MNPLQKPRIIPIWNNLPAELQALDQWVLWRWEQRKDTAGNLKWTKPPYRPDGKKAESDDPTTWTTFNQVRVALTNGGDFSGIGYVFSETDTFFGLDCDHCLDDQLRIIDPQAEQFVRLLNTFTEISPSRDGLKLWGRGKKPGNRCRIGNFELYDKERYFTTTGEVWPPGSPPKPIADRQAELETIYQALFPKQTTVKRQAAQTSPLNIDDAQLLELARKAKNGANFIALYDRGDTTSYGNDDSRADVALCSLLAFWTGRDAARIDLLFRRSQLMRDKWNRDDYRERTIEYAIGQCDEIYTPPPLMPDEPEYVQAIGNTLVIDDAEGNGPPPPGGYRDRKAHALLRPPASGSKDQAPEEPPRPLYREIPPAEPFPLDALGKWGAAAAYDVQRATRAPASICGQSVLAAMNLVEMGHVDIQLPHGEVKPISEYFATLAESGARKTSADNRATAGVVKHQDDGYEDHRKKYFEYENDLEAWGKARSLITARKNGSAKENRKRWKQELEELGERPEPPVSNTILIGADPTYEGMHRFFREGGGVIAGQFTSEGGAFVGGHSMSDEVWLRTAAGLSLMWDGTDLRRVRASERHSVLRGRRLALHLLIQPRIAQKLFNNLDLVDQGLLTRILAVMPEAPLASDQLFEPAGDLSALDTFSSRVKEQLGRPFKYLNESRPRDGLSPFPLRLDPDATRLWIDYHDDVQAQLVPGGDWYPIRGLARKAPEHAARLAATIARFDNHEIEMVPADYMLNGITLMDFYLAERVRIHEGMTVNEDLTIAADLLKWLHNVWKERQNLISLRDIYQRGPYAIRDKATAEKITAILVDHGWLVARQPCEVNGNPRQVVWTIVRDE
jgi:hypothetical protein